MEDGRALGWWERAMVELHFPVLVVAALRTTTPLQEDVVRAAVAAATRRHAAMRSAIDASRPHSEADPWRFRTASAAAGPLAIQPPVAFHTVADAADHHEQTFDAFMHRHLLHRALVYDGRSPLWAVDVVRVADDEEPGLTRLCLFFSHALGDGTSGHVVINELLTRYAEFAAVCTTVPEAERESCLQQCVLGVPLGRLLEDVETGHFGPVHTAEMLRPEDRERAHALVQKLRLARGAPKMPAYDFAQPPAAPVPFGTKVANRVLLASTSDPALFDAVHAACRRHGVTVGALLVGAVHFAVAKHNHEHAPGGLTFPWQFNHDLDANLRKRVSPALAPDSVGCFIGQFQARAELESAATPFWRFVQAMGASIDSAANVRNEALFYHPACRLFGLGGDGATEYAPPDLNLSNVGPYPFATSLPAAGLELQTVHTCGWFAPEGASYVFLTHTVGGRFCFSWVFVDDASARARIEAVQRDVQDLLVRAPLLSDAFSIGDFLRPA